MAETIRVLHVDDEPDFAALTAEFLARESDAFDVVSEARAQDGLDRLAREDVDCVVSDYDMPGMDGLAFLDAVRAEHPDLPFILFTGKGSEEVASEAISLGVTDYLQKQPGSDQYAVLANRIRNAVARSRAEERAEFERIRFESLTNAANVGILVVDTDSEVRFANPAIHDVLGYDPDALVGTSLTDLMPAEFREAHLAGVKRYLETGERTLDWSGVEFPGLHEDGHEVPLSVSFGAFEQGGERYFTGIVRDAAEPPPGPGAEREREEEGEPAGYRTLVETVADPLFLLDPEGRIRMTNEAMARRLGCDREELVGRHASEFVSEADFERGREVVRRLLSDPGRRSDSFEARVVGGDGEEMLVEVNLSVLCDDGEFAGTAGAVRDVTDRKRHERELADQRSLLEAVMETSIDGVLLVSEDREHVTWNQQLLDMWGVSEETIRAQVGTSVPDEIAEKVAESGEFLAQTRHLYEHPEEERRDQLVLEDGRVLDRYTAPVTAGDGTYYGRVWFFRDVTQQRDRERAIEALHAVTREFMHAGTDEEVAGVAVSATRDVLDMPLNTVWLADENGERLRPVAWTDGVEELIGEPPAFERGDGLAWSAFEAGESRAYGDVSAEPGRRNPDTPFRGELLLPLGDAGLLIAGSTDVGAFDELDRSLGEILASNAQAALERARRQEELERQNDRLSEFASIVSHDLRNPLNVAEGRLELAREEGESEHHEEVARALERMRALIDDLLALSRAGEGIVDVEPVDLASLVEACWSNVRTGEAELRVATRATVRADRSRLAQLVENLFRNAVEHGGAPVTVAVGDLEGGFYVEDDGVGVPRDEREAVFESGYSNAREGTGFGLAIVQGVAEAHGWDVQAAEGAEGGARFEVTGVDVLD